MPDKKDKAKRLPKWKSLRKTEVIDRSAKQLRLKFGAYDQENL